MTCICSFDYFAHSALAKGLRLCPVPHLRSTASDAPIASAARSPKSAHQKPATPPAAVAAATTAAVAAERKAKGDFTNSRAIIDACKPFHWKDKYPKVNQPSPEVRKDARRRFGYLLE